MTHDDALGRLPGLVGLRTAGDADAALRAHVAGCARCRERLRHLRDLDAGLHGMDPGPAPSADLERRVLAIPGSGAPARPRAARRGWIAAAACAAVLLACGAAVLAVRGGDAPAPTAAAHTVALSTRSGDPVDARLEMGDPVDGRMRVRLVASGLPHGDDRFYGLWLTGPGGAVSGGTFVPDGRGRCVVMMMMPSGPWTAVDITSGDRPPSPRTTVAHADL